MLSLLTFELSKNVTLWWLGKKPLFTNHASCFRCHLFPVGYWGLYTTRLRLLSDLDFWFACLKNFYLTADAAFFRSVWLWTLNQLSKLFARHKISDNLQVQINEGVLSINLNNFFHEIWGYKRGLDNVIELWLIEEWLCVHVHWCCLCRCSRFEVVGGKTPEVETPSTAKVETPNTAESQEEDKVKNNCV